MQNKTKRLSVLLGLALGAPAVVAPVVMPSHAPAAIAQETAEYPDVPQNHWAYDAINKLSQAGIIEGMPNGTYMGNKPMTRYEFAVAVARILDKIGGPGGVGGTGVGRVKRRRVHGTTSVSSSLGAVSRAWVSPERGRRYIVWGMREWIS